MRRLLCVAGFVCLLAARTGRPTAQDAPLIIPSLAGQDLFRYYCATCHAADAKGGGPVATALKTPPPDLTRMSRRNGGSFPRVRAVQFIGGGGATLRGAHGSNAMPVWGPIFHALDPSDDRLVLIRIEHIVQYLESIQEK